ncbi:hypothetical protein CRV12_00385 [Candidatus Pantoea edessiphila]|uniref:UPF0434 protein CRV12_00385 n=1 Tax=Candidatus Pantoea edessiphila TaxID=2044610 RepID=A0A2P5T0G5_9GAMM|nr:Trm112 family protein [Candidatus Pantoea edessiphila]PPI88088.1 hypothetical protein CRV12_00385 [Candidatus Pantoea edessiphila]
MDNYLLKIITCPICNGKLTYNYEELICNIDFLAYPIKNGIPILIENNARKISINDNN